VDRQDHGDGQSLVFLRLRRRLRPFFLKFGGYFPYNAKLCLNGNEYARRQAAKAGIAFEALDNAFASVGDAGAVQRICDGMGVPAIDGLARKWLARLPHPFSPADRAAGYRYDISVLQAEFSLTQMLDRPVSGRVFFEQIIRDNLDIGRPDQIALVFGRRLMARKSRPTPGKFRTRVITDGVTPSLHVDYKSTRVKQYHNCDMRSHAVSEYADWRSARCRRRSPGQRRKTCPRRDVRASLLGWQVRSSRESPRIPDPSGDHRRGEGWAWVNASELLQMPR
jgi:hypothetical protein